MSWGPLLVNLGVTAVTVAVLMLATFWYAMRTRVHAIMDTVWALGFVIIAAVSFGLSAGDGVPGRRGLVLVLTAVWGVRLSAHICLRNRGQGEDKRYASLLRRNTGSLAAFVLRHIYWAQGRVMWFVSLPLQVAMYEHAALSSVTWLGVAVWAVGFGFETVGDWQLRRFRASPFNAGQVLDRGLWRYTRHPNYFGVLNMTRAFAPVLGADGGGYSRTVRFVPAAGGRTGIVAADMHATDREHGTGLEGELCNTLIRFV